MDEQIETQQTTFVCPKCGNSNVSIQVVNEAQLVTKHHGIIWWIIVSPQWMITQPEPTFTNEQL